MANSGNFKVVIKSRPLIKRERDAKQTSQWNISENTIECVHPMCRNKYAFDHVYDGDKTTEELYEEVAKPIVQKSVQGINGTIFAYGQTSSGKTHTMLGGKDSPGVIRLATRQIFNEITHNSERTFFVRVYYLEIYNEKVFDLLNDREEVKMKDAEEGLSFGCTAQIVTTEDEILNLIECGNSIRKVAQTNMNVQSSRSHAILQLRIESTVNMDSAAHVSFLNLVDLAGSERADSTGTTGERLKEASNINKSLLTLSIVINKLSEDPKGHIPYRDSKLTRMLQNSLGGNSMTVMICAITPAALEETNLTLGFATRAKKVENKPIVNEVVSDAVAVKRMKKTIVELEKKLGIKDEQIDELKQKSIKAELQALKQMTIQGNSRFNRRRTWAHYNTTTPEPLVPLGPLGLKPPPLANNVKLLRNDRGCGDIERGDDDFQNIMDYSVFANPVDIDFDASQNDATAEEFKKPLPKRRESLLKTPKSFLRVYRTDNNDSPVSSSVASPILFDKTKRIRSLEAELEEIRHFKQTETDSLEDEVAQKTLEIEKLNQQLLEAKQQISDVQSKLDTANREVKEAKADQLRAAEQEKIAVQNHAGIEYTFEQHKLRAERREKELIDQIDNAGNDGETKKLKQKLTEMTKKVDELQTHIVQDERKQLDTIKELEKKLSVEKETSARCLNELEKMKEIQAEYDSVSLQLVDFIQDNDRLQGDVTKLNSQLTELESAIAEQKKEISEQNKKISEQEKEIVAQNKEISQLKAEHDELLTEYMQLDHNNNLANNYSAQCRLVMESLQPEMNIIRTAFKSLEMEQAKQELENLKLQKTITEFDDSMINTGYFNDTASVSMADQTRVNASCMDIDTTTCANEQSLKGQNATENSQSANESKVVATETSQASVESKQVAAESSHVEQAQERQLLIDELTGKIAAQEQREKDLCDQTQELNDIKAQQRHEIKRLQQLVSETMQAREEADLAHKTEREDLLASVSKKDGELKEKIDLLDEQSKELIKRQNKLQELLCEIEQLKAKEQTMIDRDQVLGELQLKITQLEEERKSLKTGNVKLNATIDNHSEQIARLKEELAQQKETTISEVDEHQGKPLEEAQFEIAKLQGIVSDLEQVKKDDEEKILRLGSEIKDLQKECAQMEDERATLQASNEKLMADTEAVKAEVTALEQKCEQLAEENQLELAEKAKMIQEREEQIEKAQREIERLTAFSDDEIQNKITDLEMEIVAKNQQIEEQTEENEVLKKEIVQLSAEIQRSQAEASQELKEKEDEIQNARIEIERLKEDGGESNEEVQTKMNNLQLQIEAQNQEIEAQRQEIDEHKGKAESLQKEFNGVKAELEQRLADKLKELKELEEQLKTAQSEISLIMEAGSLHNQAHDENRSTISHLQGEIAAKNQTIDEQKGEIEALQKEKERLSGEMKRGLAEKSKELEVQQDQLKAAQEEMDRLKGVASLHDQSNEANQSKINGLQMEITAKNRSIEEQKVAIRAIQHKMDQLAEVMKRSLAEKSKELFEQLEQLKQATSEIAKLKGEAGEKLKKIAELTQIVSNHEKLRKGELEKFDEFKAEINALKEEQERLENSKQKMQVKANGHSEELVGLRKELERLSQVEKQTTTLKETCKKLDYEKQQLIDEMTLMQRKVNAHLDGSIKGPQMPTNKRRDRTIDIDSLIDENKSLKSMQKHLEKEVDELRNSNNCVRKIKRQSIHDDTRRLSGFDSTMIDLGTQTDPVDDMCACKDMAQQIVKLKEKIIIVESKFAMFKLSTGVDELKTEVKTLKAELSANKSKMSRLNIEYEKITDKYEELKVKQSIAQYKPTTNNTGMQTDPPANATFCQQIDLERLHHRAEKYKKNLEQAAAAYNAQKSTLEDIKKQLDVRSSECTEATKALEALHHKYIQMKRVCNNRYDEKKSMEDQVATLQKSEAGLKTEIAQMKATLREAGKQTEFYQMKYTKAKGLLEHRKMELDKLQGMLEKITAQNANRENIPMNN